MKMVSFICNDDGTFAPCSQGGEDFLAEYRAALQERDAALAAKEKAEGALCRAKEDVALLSSKCSYCHGTGTGWDDGKCVVCADAIAALSSPVPCPHAEEARRLEKELFDERALSMDPRVPDAHWCDEDGKEYTLKWDHGDPSVGIWPGYSCEELDALHEKAKRLEEAVEWADKTVSDFGFGSNPPMFPSWFRSELRRRAAGREGK